MPGGQEALVEAAEVSQRELVGVHLGVLGTGDVYPPHPVAPLLQRRDEVVADEAAGPGDQDTRMNWGCHWFLSAHGTAARLGGRRRARFQAVRGAGAIA